MRLALRSLIGRSSTTTALSVWLIASPLWCRPIHAFAASNSPSSTPFPRHRQCQPLSTSSSSLSRITTTMSATPDATTPLEKPADPYTWLEEVESTESLDFAKSANAKCLATLGDPTNSDTYDRVLAVLESNDRIPYVSQYGHDESGQAILFNFWKDASNPKGLWRKTTLESYKSDSPEWTTVLDVDALAKEDDIGWVYKGSRPLARARDEVASSKMVERSLLQLSRGGSDAVHVKEFDLTTNQFVPPEEQPFYVPEAKTRISYKSRNVVLVGTDVGPNALTDSGYPRQVREWVRGTPLAEAPVVFEGEATDVSVSAYISDERIWGGGIYEIRARSMTFYTSKYWMREVEPEHLLEPAQHTSEPPEFTEVDIQDDADMSLLGNLMLLSLRSDWQPVPDGPVYKKGSLVSVTTRDFLANGASKCTSYEILFEPTERSAYEYFTATKNYLVLATMENVKSKLDFYKITSSGPTTVLTRVGGPSVPQIRDCSVSPVDPHSGSDAFWFTTSDYITPTTLFLADAALVEQDVTEGADQDKFIVEKLKELPPKYKADGLQVTQQFATSKDGTEIPYFIVRSKEMELNGKNPTLLYGYGGFEVSLGPKYIATSGLAWLERGGVYVEANIRGGGEFGPAYHQAALKANRNKAYEDFIAVGEDLIASGICQPETLAARGGSNGGLLMGNMFTMRPDLFAAIHCAVPLLDMKRYHTLLAGASWMAEYGNPDTDDWDFLQKYSPYHNIDPKASYPPILVTTSTRDDRVHPAHARKFVKKLWDTNAEWPVYYYENIEGGHGGAADAKQSAFMTSLAYDFMYATLTKNAEKL